MDHVENLSIRTIRVINKHSQEYIAEYLGVSVPVYSRKENGKAQFSAIEIYKLAHLYKMSSSDAWAIFFENQFNESENSLVEVVENC